ncbi:MAG: type II secretion system protein J [Phycisphaerae bacterium]
MTLLEVVLAMGLLVVLSSMTFWFYRSALDTREVTIESARRLRLTRAVLDRMAREIRQASVVTAGGRIGIRGKPDRLWLSTVRLPRPPANPYELLMEEETGAPVGAYDLVKVEYKIVRHPDILDPEEDFEMPLGLARIEIREPRKDSAESGEAFEDEDGVALDAGTDGDTFEEGDFVEFADDVEDVDPSVGDEVRWDEVYAPEVRYLRFCYFDGNKWWNEWEINGENPLPQIVQVTIGYDARPAYGEEILIGEDEDLFCECLNSDDDMSEIDECEPLPPDTYTILVRVPQADTFFGSRIAREAQALVEEVEVP